MIEETIDTRKIICYYNENVKSWAISFVDFDKIGDPIFETQYLLAKQTLITNTNNINHEPRYKVEFSILSIAIYTNNYKYTCCILYDCLYGVVSS